MLSDEVEGLKAADRSACPAARPAAGRTRALATLDEVRSPKAKFTVPKTAASDEPIGPFSAAAFGTCSLCTEMDIQGRDGTPGPAPSPLHPFPAPAGPEALPPAQTQTRSCEKPKAQPQDRVPLLARPAVYVEPTASGALNALL